MAYQWTRQQKIVRGVWAVGFVAVISVGALTGAQLKTDKQKEEAIRTFRETTPESQIAMLEEHKADLLKQKALIQRKIDLFKERVEERKLEKEQKPR